MDINSIYSINPDELDKLYADKKYDELSEKITSIFIYFSLNNYIELDEKAKSIINRFIDKFLDILINPDYILNPVNALNFINSNPLISNLVAISHHKTTDEYIEILKNISNTRYKDTDDQQGFLNNFVKILILYSARNTVKIDIKNIFSVNQEYASIWYYNYFLTDSFPTLAMSNNIVEHIKNIDPRLELIPNNIVQAFFTSTYYDTENDKKVKHHINNLIKNNFKHIKINNTPDRKKIAIITERWQPRTAIYRAYFDYIKELSEDYELTLINLGGKDTSEIDTSLFKEIKSICIEFKDNELLLDLEPIENNNFMAVIYPDIGLNTESIFLSNLRIAPIQVTTYSQPISTHGSEIDYFIGGNDVEDKNCGVENYSERLVLIPGIGAYPIYPKYDKKNIRKATDMLIINCSWSAMKLNYQILQNIKNIIASVNKKVLFRFFIARTDLSNIPLKAYLDSILGEDNIELIPFKESYEYMQILEEGHLSLDSYPWGGYTTIISALYLNQIIITLEGKKAYNRIASAVLRRVGLEELIATNHDEYINKVIKIINDDEYRINLYNKIAKIDLKGKIFNTEEPKYFKKAIDYLIDNHDKLKEDKSKEPIIIDEILDSNLSDNAQVFQEKYTPQIYDPNKQMVFSTDEFDKLYFDKKYDLLSKKFIEILTFFNNKNYLQLKDEDQLFIDVFVNKFLYFFTQPDYVIDSMYFLNFIELNPVISNVVAMSCYKNTDEYIQILKNTINDNQNNLVKILTLYSARNNVKVDFKNLYEANSNLLSSWYYNYFAINSFPTALMNNNILEHINNIDSNITFNPFFIGNAYYICTYYDPDNDKKIKAKINMLSKDYFKNIKINNTPDNKKIAIVTKRWIPDNAIYKTCFDYIKELASDYDLTLIHLTDMEENIDKSLFKEIKNIKIESVGNEFQLDLSQIQNNNFMAVIYPDIGLNSESVFLSNLRIAPIQVTTYSHTVSTFGSEIDYYICGQDVENLNYIKDNYSEKPVLIPGIGVYPIYPDYKKKNVENATDIFIITCPWGIPKINYQILKNLKVIIQKSNKKLLFKFLGGSAAANNNRFIPLEKEIGEILGYDNFKLHPYKNSQEYMELMEEGAITINSYPVGGFNTLINSLYLGKPIVVMEGKRAHNRIDSAVLRRLGLNELIATSHEEYMNKIFKLINDNEYRQSLCDKIRQVDLKGNIFNTDESKYFKKAIDYLIDNHDKLKKTKSNKPIIIKSDKQKMSMFNFLFNK